MAAVACARQRRRRLLLQTGCYGCIGLSVGPVAIFNMIGKTGSNPSYPSSAQPKKCSLLFVAVAALVWLVD